MIKKLTKVGNSVGLILDQAVLEMYHFDREAEIIPQADGILIKPAKPGSKATRRDKVRKALEETKAQFGEALKKLS